MVRRALMLGAMSAFGVPVPAVAVEPAFLDPGAHIFTLAGGGTEVPRDGLPAWRVRLGEPVAGVLPVSAFPDGSLATVDSHGDPFRIGLDGRVRILPRVLDGTGRQAVTQLAAGRDGSLAAVAESDGWIYRLAPGAAVWERAVDLRRLPGRADLDILNGLVWLPDGGYALAMSSALALVGARRARDSRQGPRNADGGVGAVAVRGDGGVAFHDGRALAVAGRDGSTRVLPIPFVGAFSAGLAGLADGRLLLADGNVQLLDERTGVRVLAGTRPGLGIGDGAPAARALTAADGLALAADGALIISEKNPLAGPRAAVRHTGGRDRQRLGRGADADRHAAARRAACGTARDCGAGNVAAARRHHLADLHRAPRGYRALHDHVPRPRHARTPTRPSHARARPG